MKRKAELAFTLHQRVKRLRETAVSSFWELIEMLMEVKQREYFKILGYDTFAAYLCQPELCMNPVTTEKYFVAYRKMLSLRVPVLELKRLPRSKVSLIAPHLRDENAKELVELAQALSWSDLRAELKLRADGKEIDETGRPPKPSFVWCTKHQRWSLTQAQLKQICIH